MQDQTVLVLATDARINERLIARGMDPMDGPCLAEVIHEATGERLTSKEALRLWGRERLARRPAGPRGAATASREPADRFAGAGRAVGRSARGPP